MFLGRYAGSMVSAHGRSDARPYSSWLNQLPSRPMAWANGSAGATAAHTPQAIISPYSRSWNDPTCSELNGGLGIEPRTDGITDPSCRAHLRPPDRARWEAHGVATPPLGPWEPPSAADVGRLLDGV